MHRLRKPEGGYLAGLAPSVSLAESVQRAIDAMRRAGLDGSDMRGELFEVDIKAHELRQIHDEYVEELRRHNWIDHAEVYRLAIERLRSDPAAISADVLILVPADIDVSGLGHQLLGLLPSGRRVDLPVDQPGRAPAGDGEPLTDAKLLRWLPAPADAPPPIRDGSASIFRAIGEVNEVREVLRRCLVDGIPLERGRGALHRRRDLRPSLL